MTNIVITLLALIFSAFFSAYEIAFFSSNKLKIELDRKEGKKYALAMSKFIAKPEYLISTLLMGNNVSLVIYGISIAKILNPIIANHISSSLGAVLAIETITATLIVLVTAEFLPKIFGKSNPNSVFSTFYWLTLFFYYLLYPLTFITQSLSLLIIKCTGLNKSESIDTHLFDKSDLLNLSCELGGAEEQEDEHLQEITIFQNALHFSQVKIKECMIPRTEIVSLEINESIDALLALFVESGYSRIIIYRENIDNIIGYAHSKSLFGNNLKKVEECVRKLAYFNEQMSAQKLLAYLIKNRMPLAVVRDEYGGTSGIVTIEDLIEEIFGEISDELDREEFIEKKISDNEFIFSARLEVKEINRKFCVNLPESEEYETLAGLIIFYNEDIPQENEVLKVGKFLFTIDKTSNKRIETVSLKVIDE